MTSPPPQALRPLTGPGAKARWLRRAVALGSGALAGFSFPGFGLEWLAYVCFAGPILLLFANGEEKACPRAGFRLGWLFGVGFYAVALHWMVPCLAAFSGLPFAVTLLVFAVFTGYHALVYACGYSVLALGLRLGMPAVAAAPIALAGAELAFPSIGPIHIGTALGRWDVLRQATEVFGMSGLTAVAAVYGAAVAELVRFLRTPAAERAKGPTLRTMPSAAVAFVIMVCLGGFGRYRIAQVDEALETATRSLRVGICQANIGGVTKNLHREEALATYRGMVRDVATQGVDLVLLPENSWPETISAYTEGLPPGYFGAPVPTIVGALDETPNRRYRNAALLFDADGKILDRYAKQRLVPLGEYVPLADRLPWLLSVLPHADNFEAGTSDAPIRFAGLQLTTFICYEAIYPRLIGRLLRAGDGPPDVLINLTNDSWYGQTTEQRLHLAYTAFRAVEARRSLVRATNTGISALIDPAGRVTARTGEHVAATLVGSVPVVKLPTLFICGGWVAPGLLLISFFVVLGLGWRRARRDRADAS